MVCFCVLGDESVLTKCVNYLNAYYRVFSMRWAGNVARMRRRGMHIGYWWESQKERDHWEDRDVGGWTILKRILGRMGWCGLD
jgi:hypothetical protein